MSESSGVTKSSEMAGPAKPDRLGVESVCRRFTLGEETTSVLDGVSFELRCGQSMAIVGPSGSGKSTLLHILGTLDRPDEGRVLVGETVVTELSDRAAAAFRNRHIGFIFQDHALLPQLSVIDNVLIPALANGRVTDAQSQHAEHLIDVVGLADRRNHRPGQLSGGQRERVAIARALLMRPSLILADEPTGNLDRHTADRVAEVLIDLPRTHQAMLVTVTHDRGLADRMDVIRELHDGVLREVNETSSG